MPEQRFADRVAVRLGDDGVAEVRLSRADKMNALDAAMFDGLLLAGEHLRRMHGLRAVVLHGEGRAFCAGLDMASFGRMAQGQSVGDDLADLVTRTHGLANRAQQVAWQWHELAVPVVAAVHGVAFGGGLQLALGADIRCVAPEARLSVLEMQWGLVPDMAGMALLRELVRADVARELIYSARVVGGEEACRIGLATLLAADPLSRTREFARDVAQRNTDAVCAAKRLLNASPDADAASLLRAESVEQQALIGSPNQREAVAAALAKRPPVFSPPA
ncbi:MAG: crotonase/enoyl-CoA hydratase family protein [Hydrogenophaga sp.]|uniref:crotonase/enoyl-CoA hydratase family protein n=1 Tax=Hydrogenophaga sp. TaxID=1904254 RepID=UPI0027340A1C|nr:crotonase/enoyl-CoA hydratase family protein [Hydrogenophaga sp.]MDP3626419.1 crotonase/enoyl-CoA hydratase family protein [Hydrogenophaga sp.]